jgi:hypothetical protein
VREAYVLRGGVVPWNFFLRHKCILLPLHVQPIYILFLLT